MGFGQLLADIGQYEDVVVYAVDRLARDVRVGYALLETLQAADVRVHTATEGMLDLKNDAGALNFGVRLLLSDSERRRVVKRLAEGKRAKVRAGQPVLPLNAYGWHNSEPHPGELPHLQELFRRALVQGAPGIALTFHREGIPTRGGGVWQATTIRQILANPLYRGEYSFGKGVERVTCEVPALIDPQLWYAVQEAQERRRLGQGRRGRRLDLYPLTGRIRCGVCGRAMVGHPGTGRGGKQYFYYRCSSQARASYLEKNCAAKGKHRTHEIHAVVEAMLASWQQDDAALSAGVKVPQPAAPDFTGALADVEKRLARLERQNDAGAFDDDPDTYAAKRRALLAERVLWRERQAEPAPAAPPVDLVAARAALAAAQGLPLEEVVERLNLQVTVGADGRVDVQAGM